ncbi:MAG: AtpZ/AtpI family protein [Tepidisphaeraceae bacterium]
MSRLDQHVSAVQNKLALGRFCNALGWTLTAFAVAVGLGILVDRFFQVRPPWVVLLLWGGLAACVLAAIVWAVARRPTRHAAAVAIDDVLQTREKFSTALQVRGVKDSFASAAVLDAEDTATRVDLRRKFPLSFPRSAYGAIVATLVASSLLLLKPMDLLGREERKQQQRQEQAKVEAARKQLKDALAVVDAVPQAVANEENIKLAKQDLIQALNAKIDDPERANRTAAKALQDVSKAIKEQIKSNQRYAEAQNDAKMFKQLQSPVDEQGPVADAQRALAKGNFQQAVDELTKLTEKFDKLDKKDQEKAADQMKAMAQQLQKMANNPQQQQQLQQQLQKMGLNQQQAQQMQQMMQQAAQGDKQAQQQLQQMAQQAMQQLQQQANQGNQQAQQQLQQMQKMLQQMQANANTQAQAQQMQQAAQQMAKAMQQAAQQNGQLNAQQNQQGNQQMNQGMQQMAQQLQQMQAAAQDAQQIGAAQQMAQNAAQQAMNGLDGGKPGQQNPQQGNGNWQANGNLQNNGQNNPWNGQANNGMGPNPGGQGAGDRSAKEQAPYAIKQEFSPSLEDEKGKILASMFVRASSLKGESKEQLKQIAESAQKESADEIDQDRITRQAQKVVREYFGSMQREAESVPTTQPQK